jgi:hypothetical protein
MKKIDWILVIVAFAAVAVFFYRLGRRDLQYETLSAQVGSQDTRISEVEDSLVAHEQRWHFLNCAVDWIRGLLPWK